MSEQSAAFAEFEPAKLDMDRKYIVAALRDPVIRGLAAVCAAELGLVDAIPILQGMLRLKDSYVRSAAAAALGRLNAREARMG